MKCPICNAENAPETSSCHQCGFSLSLSQSSWPDSPKIEVPAPSEGLEWPELPTIEVPHASASPIQPTDYALAIRPKDPAAGIADAEVSTPDQPSLDDTLARTHITRGQEAVREGLLDQAKWEFEQAHHLADDSAIAEMAQEALAELQQPAVEEALPTDQPIKDNTVARVHLMRGLEAARQGQLKSARREFEHALELADNPDIIHKAQSELNVLRRRMARAARAQPRPTEKSPQPIAARPSRPANWGATFRTALLAAAVSGVLIGIAADVCATLFITSIAGFVAGRLAARGSKRSGKLAETAHPIVVGIMIGMGGWLGQTFSYIAQLSSSDTSNITNIFGDVFLACTGGAFLTALAVVAAVLGWSQHKVRK